MLYFKIIKLFYHHECFLLEVQFTSHKMDHFKVNNSVTSITLTVLRQHHLCLRPEHSHHHRRKSRPISPHSPFLCPLGLWQPLICFLYLWTYPLWKLQVNEIIQYGTLVSDFFSYYFKAPFCTLCKERNIKLSRIISVHSLASLSKGMVILLILFFPHHTVHPIPRTY